MLLNYQKICQDFFKDLPQKQKEVILRRFGLETGERETLESIGKSYGVTRERIRQIQEAGFSKLKQKIEKNQKAFQHISNYLKNSGDLMKEDVLLSQLGGKDYRNYIFFLLTLGKPFQRFSETKDIYSLWTINPGALDLAKKVIDSISNKFRSSKKLLTLEDLKSQTNFSLTPQVLQSYLEISKIIQRNSEGLFGLKDWPEINPRGVKDKAYLVFKKEKKPLHFREVAKLIGPETLSQTVHNELIKDPRFILIGRGLYALGEWGYEAGQVKDIILKILKEAGRPLSREEVLEKVLKQRLVKQNTILLNLNKKDYFLRNPDGKYMVKEI